LGPSVPVRLCFRETNALLRVRRSRRADLRAGRDRPGEPALLEFVTAKEVAVSKFK
jgi:hypothetical protein